MHTNKRTRLKGKFYKTEIRAIVTHGTEFWPIEKLNMQNMCTRDEKVESKNKKERIKNEHICEHLGVASVDDKLRYSFEMVWTYVQCRPIMVLARKVSLCR